MNMNKKEILRGKIQEAITFFRKNKIVNNNKTLNTTNENIINVLCFIEKNLNHDVILDDLYMDIEDLCNSLYTEDYALIKEQIVNSLRRISIWCKKKNELSICKESSYYLNYFESIDTSTYSKDNRFIIESIKKLTKRQDNLQKTIDSISQLGEEFNVRLEKLASAEQYIDYIVDAAQQSAKDSQKVTAEVRGLANIASQSGLAKEFEKCIRQLQPGRVFWLIMVIISILGMGWILIWDLLNIPSPNSGYDIFKNWVDGLMHRLPIIFPCLFAVWLSSRRYHDTVRLIEDYRFKSRLCATYSGFLDACRRIDGCTEMATTGEGGQPVVQTRRSYDAEMELTRTVLRVISTDPTRHLRKDKQDSGPILGLAEHCVDAIAGVVKRDRKGD